MLRVSKCLWWLCFLALFWLALATVCHEAPERLSRFLIGKRSCRCTRYMQPSMGEVVADELQAFCLLSLDIKIVKKKEEVSLFIYFTVLMLIFLFYRMVRRNPGTSCELMTGKNIHNCLLKWHIIIFFCVRKWWKTVKIWKWFAYLPANKSASKKKTKLSRFRRRIFPNLKTVSPLRIWCCSRGLASKNWWRWSEREGVWFAPSLTHTSLNTDCTFCSYSLVCLTRCIYS